ncbi:FtsX-like permease family protein [Paenisporosarcina antarctica]|uniref:ABC transporter permease n=1 Tax=Paenisporosarcina antarctica TaxID=417367 RepID=A0A4P6ZWL1_9BACL|nr:ABC transporter permease [Paenisporosarcina antarctica]QBP40448.1 ABC transporter permease [Paenisporosarcina antarctica]
MTFRQFAYRNVVRNRRIYAAFFMASMFSVMVFFMYSMLLFHPKIEDEFLRSFAASGMIVAEVILYIFTLFFLFYSMSAFLQSRSKEFGLLLQLGMEKKQLNKLIFLETMLIGMVSVATGIFFGYAFSKFFFMIVRELLQLEGLPLYVSFKPFALTIGAFFSLFVIIAMTSVVFIREQRIIELIRGYRKTEEQQSYSTVKAIFGICMLLFAYAAAAFTSMNVVLALAIVLPPVVALGTYFFFTDSILFLLHQVKKRKSLYWHRINLIAISEVGVKLRENARMYFIVTIVSTVAFLSVGTLTSLSSYTGQFREINPLSLIYSSELTNPYESNHISLLRKELEEQGLSYTLVPFLIKKQTSSSSQNSVDILRQSDVNSLAVALGLPLVELKPGKGLLIPYSEESIESLKNKEIQTVLEESNVPIQIRGVYQQMLFPSMIIGSNIIVVSDEDYQLIDEPLEGNSLDSSYKFFAFHVAEWERTKSIGLQIDSQVTDAIYDGAFTNLPFYFENPGLNYSVIRATFSLLLFTGLMVAAVLLLAAGSFVYFKLYTGLERDKRQFEVLKRMGLTDKELVKIVNRQLVPQFFLPWGIAMLHSAFSFLSLQVIWRNLAEVSILSEMVLVLVGFTFIQVLYYFLIRWRYIAHVRAS